MSTTFDVLGNPTGTVYPLVGATVPLALTATLSGDALKNLTTTTYPTAITVHVAAKWTTNQFSVDVLKNRQGTYIPETNSSVWPPLPSSAASTYLTYDALGNPTGTTYGNQNGINPSTTNWPGMVVLQER